MNDIEENIIEALKELASDSTVPKNIKEKIHKIVGILAADEDTSLKISKAMAELEEMSDDSNIQQYTRTQIYNIISMLEMI